MRYTLLTLIFCCAFMSHAQAEQVVIETTAAGSKLKVAGRDFMVNGMNWDYFPIGTNYSYSLWSQDDLFIEQALKYEMGLLKEMGVNAIRVYTGIPTKWIEYIHKNFGIYTMLNHSFGRYGLEIEKTWIANTEYGDPKTKEILMQEVKDMAQTYKNTSGLLLYLLGNENNYGLTWGGAETEDIPVEDQKTSVRARALYKAFNEATLHIKKIDTNVPVAICNGDLLFFDLLIEECPDVDIFGANVYRGLSFGNFFKRVKNEYNKPILFTEFGSDAYDALANKEDQESQALYCKENWKEIYENAAGLGKSGNSLGGFTFQFSDGWWKYGQTKNLNMQDNNASWANGGYAFDFKKGNNNMNEEWFGICIKKPVKEDGFYDLVPRKAYYILKEIHTLNPYQDKMKLKKIEKHFDKIKL
jgi:hypothetical protein